ncbi:MAG: alpha-ketoacid dehydrogenase subunit beta [Planctomycetes bacterium]|nr:alpha-ketoacid dehydrogenase subunit beta [Planctomycetota bacterium]
MGPRCVDALNQALHEAFEASDRVCLIGEDVFDPYGGAFKVTRGLSTKYPDRVYSSPISEAGITGVAVGMALRGLRPVVEIMFGDFICLAFDQIVNHASKLRAMYDDQVTCPLVLRAAMGGRRGYGPTHSQSLEKHLVGVPHIAVAAPSAVHPVRDMLRRAILEDDRPVVFLENKLLYGERLLEPEGGRFGEFAARTSEGLYPTVVLSLGGFEHADLTIVTFGGMVPFAMRAAEELLLEEEVYSDVVVLGQLAPPDLTAVLPSVERSGRCLFAEEGTLTGGVGAEWAARIQEAAWDALEAPVARVAAADDIVPCAKALEAQVLPDHEDIAAAARRLLRQGCRSRTP